MVQLKRTLPNSSSVGEDIDLGADRAAGMRIGFGCCHALARRLRSSANKRLSSAQETASAKPSNLPSRAMRLAARMKPLARIALLCAKLAAKQRRNASAR